jgi:hypothetical protein
MRRRAGSWAGRGEQMATAMKRAGGCAAVPALSCAADITAPYHCWSAAPQPASPAVSEELSRGAAAGPTTLLNGPTLPAPKLRCAGAYAGWLRHTSAAVHVLRSCHWS